MSESNLQPLLSVRDLSKQFPGVKALSGVSLDLYPGEVLAVIGENGAGKSTLMKILAGIQRPDSGAILLEGAEVEIGSIRAATALGISLIHQELNLADNLDIGANIFLGREPRGRCGVIRRRQIARDAAVLMQRVGLNVSPRTLVRHLSVGQQQMVEIAKALSVHSRILIMDEPTSSLSQRETDHLYRVIGDLKAEGVSIIYISHRLGEVSDLADRVVVLRDGKNAGELAREEICHDRMVKLMVGREFSADREYHPRALGEEVLRVDGLVTTAYPRHAISFSVRAGEIVGIGGLVGAGRTELLETLFGVRPALGGEVRVADEPVSLRSPEDAIRAGLALAPEDRKGQGLVLEMGVRENCSLATLARDARRGLLNRRAERAISGEMIGKLNIRTPSDRQICQVLSGGNQQKVVLGKWLAMRPRILLLDEPTRGIDVGAKREIYQLMEQLAESGVAILFVSSEMEEVLHLPDRAIVLHEGGLTGELSREALTEEAVMQLATGRTAAA
ncbi:MAG: sugar ABC transporter ATP-binding protein [Candidatus Hydrogenedentes bacterium]|nr:sugar ABC transporter ATP-binding protein [Candidatus Hydrogenedentota bacterium]